MLLMWRFTVPAERKSLSAISWFEGPRATGTGALGPNASVIYAIFVLDLKLVKWEKAEETHTEPAQQAIA
ncbi:MAG TPA: hypothetical protein VLB46_21470 [Pyrinomonadaceae bacterium]|nr:hypothetical protein [Pyrinomonadaceae bacterium]